MANRIIPYGKQTIDDKDIQAVVNVLTSDFLTQGPAIAQFEKEFSEYVGCNHAIAVSNGTAALHLAAMVLDTSKKIIAPPLSFVASTNGFRYENAVIEFVDIDPETWLIDCDQVAAKLKANPDAYSGIIAVNFAGRVCDFERLRELADEYNLWILEDACHSPGGKTETTNTLSGSGKLADISVFSFHPVKHIACGEGGMITTNNEKFATQLALLRTHGITRDTSIFQTEPEAIGGTLHEFPGWYMEMQTLGYNYRLTDIQAALGSSQLQKAPQGLERRKTIAKDYNDHFSQKKYILQHSGYSDKHAYHLYVILVEDRLGLYNYLREKGILTQVHYIPIHLMPYYQKLGWKPGDFPIVESYYKHCLSIPMYPGLTDDDVSFVLSSIDSYYEK